MATKGNLNLKHIQLPSAWDAAELRRLALRDGTTYEDIISDVDAAMGMAWDDVLGGWVSTLFYLTAEITAEYGQGNRGGWEDHTEYGQADGQVGDTTGHMLPLRFKDYKLGWTADFLREARQMKIDEAIGNMAGSLIDETEKLAIGRLFKMEEESGKRFGLGASGISVPFCDGGNGNVSFIPKPNPDRATAFAATHDHYLRLNGINQANLETAVGHLWEHGEDGPYELLIAQTDVTAWTNTTNVTGYKEKANALVQYGQDTTLATVDEQYIGAITTKQYGSVQVRASARIPTGYWAVYKSYGQNDPRNPLWARWDEMFGVGPQLVVAQVGIFPLQGAIGQFKLGFGVGQSRTAAVLVENDTTGDYASPTIS